MRKKITNVKRHILLIRNAIGTMWGPSPRALKWAFNGIIIPSLTYGCIVWYRACAKISIKEKLVKLNRLMSSCMLPFRKSTPTAGLEVVLDLPPLDLRVEEVALKAILRVKPQSQSKWSGLGQHGTGHLLWGTKRLSKLGVDPLQTDLVSSLNVTRYVL